MVKKYTKSEVLKNIKTYTQLITIFENQKDNVAKARSEANLSKWQNELKNLN